MASNEFESLPRLSVFFCADGSIADAAEVVGEALAMKGILESSAAGSRYRWNVLDIELLLFDQHGLVNDSGIDFESFKFELDIAFSPRQSIVNDQCQLVRGFAAVLALEIAEKSHSRTVVVGNLQHLLRTFGG